LGGLGSLGSVLEIGQSLLGGLLGGGGSGQNSGSDANNININLGGTMSDNDTTPSSSNQSQGGGLAGIVGTLLGGGKSAVADNGLANQQIPSTLPTSVVETGLGVQVGTGVDSGVQLPVLPSIDSSSGYEDIAKILSTPRRILDLTVAPGYNISNHLLDNYFSLAPVHDRLKYFKCARFTVCLKVRITASGFCCGLLRLRYVPAFQMALDLASTIYCPGLDLDVNTETEAEIRIPYYLPYRMYDVDALLSGAAGSYKLENASDNIENFALQVFCWLEDLELFYPIVPVDLQGFKTKSVTEDGHRLVIKGVPLIDDIQGIPSDIKILNPVPTSTYLDSACSDSFSSLFTRPSYLYSGGGKFHFTLADFPGVFHRINFNLMSSPYVRSFASLIPFFFQYWACSYELTFKFYKTPLHKGSLAFTFIPLTDSDDADFADHFHQILDLSQSDTITIRIPFISDSSRYILGDSPGTLICSQLVPLTKPETVAQSLSYTVTLRVCDDLVYSLPNLNPVLPPTAFADRVEMQGSTMGPDMPIPPEYNSAGPCTISEYFSKAQRYDSDIQPSFLFKTGDSNNTRTLIMSPTFRNFSTVSSAFTRKQAIVALYYGNRSEIVTNNPEQLFIYDKLGEIAPKKVLVPYLSNLKYCVPLIHFHNNPVSIASNSVAANFQGFYQWYCPSIVQSNEAWYNAYFNTAPRVKYNNPDESMEEIL